MKVMIGVDDSASSQAALEFVGKLSWPADTTVTIVSSVVFPMPTYVPASTGLDLQFEKWLDVLTQFHKDVVARDERTLRDAGMRVSSRVLEGDARDTLIAEALHDHVDLLVVGSHGRTGLARMVMGSVAAHIVAHAPCSVLVVKPRGGRK